MLALPKFTPEAIKSNLEKISRDCSIHEIIANISQAIRSALGAENCIYSVEQYSGSFKICNNSFSISGIESVCTNSVDDEFLLKSWFENGIHKGVVTNFVEKLHPISHSFYTWPYSYVTNEKNLCVYPKEFTLLLPISSELIVSLKNESQFFGYCALLFNAFPELNDFRVGLITQLPDLISQIISAAYRHQQHFHANS